MNDIVLISRAACFAAQRHGAQARKGSKGTPYINHLAEVAAFVATTTQGRDAALVAAAWLHDTIEDTATTRDEITLSFGEDVASLVMEATDDKSRPKDERKRLQEIDAPHKTTRAKILKIADKLSNVRELTADPPPDWDTARRRAYVEWAARVVAGLRGGAPELEAKFDMAVQQARSRFQP